jgi:hypothetical protein
MSSEHIVIRQLLGVLQLRASDSIRIHQVPIRLT